MSICHRAQSHRFDFEVLGSSQKRGMKLDPHRTPIRLQQFAHPHHLCSASPRLEADQLIIREATRTAALAWRFGRGGASDGDVTARSPVVCVWRGLRRACATKPQPQLFALKTKKHTRRAKPRAASSKGAPRSGSLCAARVVSRSARVLAPARGARTPRQLAGGAKERRGRGATDWTREEEEDERTAAARDVPAELRR